MFHGKYPSRFSSHLKLYPVWVFFEVFLEDGSDIIYRCDLDNDLFGWFLEIASFGAYLNRCVSVILHVMF